MAFFRAHSVCDNVRILAVFAEFERDILRDRVKAGIAQARKEGRRHGRPLSVAVHKPQIKKLFGKGLSKREIAKSGSRSAEPLSAGFWAILSVLL